VSLIAGLDYSSFAIDVVLIDEDTGDATHYRRRLDLPAAGALTRIRRTAEQMPPRSWWTDHVVAAGIEIPFARAKGGGYALQLQLGAILSCLPAGLKLHMLRADDWRRACELPTRAQRARHKRNAVDFACRHWDSHPTPLDDNTADAYCIAHATRQLLDTRAAA
jgi:hypothetical protein